MEIKFFGLAATYSPAKAVPSALQGLTSVFGMRTGVTLALSHQAKKFNFIVLVDSIQQDRRPHFA